MSTSEIDTERLTLRRHGIEDFLESAAMWADPVVTRYIGGTPYGVEESWSRLLRYVGHWELLGFGYWVFEPNLGGVPEIGWVLVSSAHGKGFATEAVRASLIWASDHFGPTQRTVCMIDPDNRASIRVGAKCGFRELVRTSYKGSPIILYER
jgi:RimJ/RimL family protein N-acetyltransferase